MCGAVEESLTAADRSPGGVTQGLARCVEAESVKNVALRQSVQLRVKKYSLVLTQINQKRQGPKERPETEFEKTGTCWIWTKRVLR